MACNGMRAREVVSLTSSESRSETGSCRLHTDRPTHAGSRSSRREGTGRRWPRATEQSTERSASAEDTLSSADRNPEEDAMTNREFYIKRWESEQPAFLKVLRAVPEGQLAYKPHERSSA